MKPLHDSRSDRRPDKTWSWLDDDEIVIHLDRLNHSTLEQLPNHLPTDARLQQTKSVCFDLTDVPTGYPNIAALAAWTAYARSKNSKCEVRTILPKDFGAREWLEEVGFPDALKGTLTSPTARPIQMGLTQVAPGDNGAPERIASDLLGLIQRSKLPMVGDTAGSIRSALSEIVENVLRHGSITTPAFVCAQVHPKTHKVALCIADTGIGIEQSFRNGSFSVAHSRLAQGADPIELALEPLMSSKFGRGHSGYGMYFASELCRSANGIFDVISGRWGRSVRTHNATRLRHRSWPGTVVTMVFSSEREVDASKIFAQMPASDPDDDDYICNFALDPSAPVVRVENNAGLLGTRDSAVRPRTQVQALLLNGPAVVDLQGATVMTPSFADELFGQLAEDLGSETIRRKLRIIGASSHGQRLIELVVRERIGRAAPDERRQGG